MKSKLILIFAFYLLILTSHVYAFVAAPTEDVKNTRHNLSSSGPTERNVFVSSVATPTTTEICVFCHTPHGANPDAVSFGAPIWNRRLSGETYTMYDQVWSKSFEGTLNTGQPTGFSRLCLSCHDGTIALGRLINPPGSGGFVRFDDATSTLKTFSMTYQNSQTSGCVGADCIPIGAGVTTGDTRLLGVDLRNDHAISFLFDTALAVKDGELVDPGAGITLHQGQDVSLTKPGIDPNLSPVKRHVGNDPNVADSVQCTSCHNPHQVDYPKFLRANRLQLDFSGGACAEGGGLANCPPKTARTSPDNLPNTAIICLFCHDKPGVPYNTADLSTHFIDPTKINLTSTVSKPLTTDLFGTTAQPLSSVINQTPATVTVAQRACLACHDPHTEQGAIRLLRQGADNSVNPPDVAIEQTCYQCHSPTQNSFNTIDTTDCPSSSTSFFVDKPDCPPDVLTQFQKDVGTGGTINTICNGEADDPDFCAPEFGLTPSNPPASDRICNNASCGSAMNLRLGLGHQPVFTDNPAEGVQMNSDNPVVSTFGEPFTIPINNKATPGGSTPYVDDTKHIECVDCHNMHRVNRTNRFRGMPGITIGTGAFGTTLDTSGGLFPPPIVAQTLDNKDVTREPYIFEVCLRCHGNTFNSHVKEQRVTAFGSGLTVQLRGNNSGQSPAVPDFNYSNPSPNPTSTTLGAGSNKRKEFDPCAKPFYTPANIKNAADCSRNNPVLATVAKLSTSLNNGLPGFNTAFHPVAAPGRNQSGVLNNCGTFTVVNNEGRCSGGGQLLGQLSRKNTIHCTDCHNSDLFGTFSGGFSQPQDNDDKLPVAIPDFPGPITFDDTRGTPYKRGATSVFSWATDYEGDLGRNTNILNFSATLASLNNPNTPQGPHGSKWRRILRSNYQTRLANKDGNDVGGGYDSRNFALCYNCHNEAAFITKEWQNPSDRLTNFYRSGTGNLHWIHLVDQTQARCHECHYNVHSNIESGNTVYVNIQSGDPAGALGITIQKTGIAMCSEGIGACNPGHENVTHLINFAPEIGTNKYNNPVWGHGYYVNGEGGTGDDKDHNGPGCNLKCHGFGMKHNYDAHSVVNGGKCVENQITGGKLTCGK
ncbi:MAG: cytochrome c3 family protein [Nitrospirae bacterium]|nr:cytochrome c3 family protein [Nitrospirota bacterium]